MNHKNIRRAINILLVTKRVRLSYRNQFSSQVTIRRRKGSFRLWRKKADEVSKRLSLRFSFNSWGTYLSIFLILPINFRWHEMIVGYTPSFSEQSLTVLPGFFSTIARKSSLSTTDRSAPVFVCETHLQSGTLHTNIEWYVHLQNPLQMQH